MSDRKVREHPDHPGWLEVPDAGDTGFNAQVIGLKLVRLEPDGTARTRMFLQDIHANPLGALHGGVIMAFADFSMFAGTSALLGQGGIIAAVTLDLSMQFVGAGTIDQPLDVIVEIVRETGRMVFCRGFVEQGDSRIASYSGILRKITVK